MALTVQTIERRVSKIGPAIQSHCRTPHPEDLDGGSGRRAGTTNPQPRAASPQLSGSAGELSRETGDPVKMQLILRYCGTPPLPPKSPKVFKTNNLGPDFGLDPADEKARRNAGLLFALFFLLPHRFVPSN